MLKYTVKSKHPNVNVVSYLVVTDNSGIAKGGFFSVKYCAD